MWWFRLNKQDNNTVRGRFIETGYTESKVVTDGFTLCIYNENSLIESIDIEIEGYYRSDWTLVRLYET